MMNRIEMDLKALIRTDRKVLLALEETEAVYWSKYYSIDDKLPCFATIVSGAFVGSVPDLDVLAMNRVIGLGMMSEVRSEDIETIINIYKKAGAKRFFIQLSPHTIQNNLSTMLSNAGFRMHNHWAKLIKKLDRPDSVNHFGFRIERLANESRQIEDYGRILFDSFMWEDQRLIAWLCKTVGKTGYRHYLAYQGNKPVAAAALHMMGSYASLAFAGTLPAFRGLGAQSALIEHRIHEAMEEGCEYIITETAVSTIEKPVQSYKNMIRMGFQEVYQRENWIYIVD